MILTITISAFAVIPAIFGQVEVLPDVITQCVVYSYPHNIGIGQEVQIQGLLYPPPPYDVEATFTLVRPDDTEVEIVKTLTGDIKEVVFYYTPDMQGTWSVFMSWDGGPNYQADSSEFRRKLNVGSTPVTYPPTEIEMRGFVGTVPLNKVGLGDYIYIVGWVSPPRELQGGIYHSDLEFVITRPDNTKESVFIALDSPATGSFAYQCTQEGTYSVVVKFPDHTWAAPYLTQLATVSPAHAWEVEEGFVAETYPDDPLPTGAWTYPISGELREWFQISGPWYNQRYDASQSYFNPYTKGPNSAHVLWTLQIDIGGQLGVDHRGYYPSFPYPVTLQGKMYITGNERAPSTGSSLPSTQPVLFCYDQFTGELLWKKTLPGTGSGGSIWLELRADIKSDPRQTYSPGELVNMWITGNGLRLVNPNDGECSYYNPSYTPDIYYDGAFYDTVYNSTDGHDYLTKWSTTSRSVLWTADLGTEWRYGDLIDTTQNPAVFVRVGSEYGGWPRVTWLKSWNTETGEMIADGPDVGYTSPEGLPSGRTIVGWGKAYIHEFDMKVHAIDIYTGEEAWVSDKAQDYPWGDFNAYNIARGYNMVFFNSWDGHIYAYDVDTGKELWKASSGDSFTETAMGTYPFWGKTIVGDGKVYAATSEHSPPNPWPRGNSLFCFDAFTGDTVWQLEHFMEGGGFSLSSGVLTYGNEYDGRIYAFAKGPSATTVMASPKVIAKGTPVLIEGTVTDESPGAPGTPAIADEDQGPWVNYLYMNYPMPMSASGVPVLLQASFPDGSYQDIGHVTTDVMGHYELLWTPPSEGTYKILALFQGTESYYESSDETALGVGPVPTPATPIEPEPTEAPFITTEIAIIAVVAVACVIGIVGFWVLRRRK